MMAENNKSGDNVTIYLENENNYIFPFDCQKVASQVAQQLLVLEQCPYKSEINLVLTGNEAIREANHSFRGIDKETDVLSFPMVDFTKPADYDILKNDSGIYFNPDSSALMLGDIMISIPKAEAQALQYGHTIKREYAFLIAHSILHLLGYDHMSAEQAEIMEKKQAAALQRLNITR